MNKTILFMKIKIKFICLTLLTLLFVQCSNKENYIIENGKVGLLNRSTEIKDLKFLFAKDSICTKISIEKDKDEESFFNDNDEYEVFSKEGEKLLSIVPVKQKDSTSKLKSIQIFTASYKTKNGLNLFSTFKDIKENYIIDKVETTFTSATLYIDELNATIAIDKKDLGMEKFGREEVALDQIPDISKIKYFTIWFN